MRCPIRLPDLFFHGDAIVFRRAGTTKTKMKTKSMFFLGCLLSLAGVSSGCGDDDVNLDEAIAAACQVSLECSAPDDIDAYEDLDECIADVTGDISPRCSSEAIISLALCIDALTCGEYQAYLVGELPSESTDYPCKDEELVVLDCSGRSR